MTMASDSSMVRLGLIGAGRIGRLHADNIAHRLRGCRLVSVADVNEEAARQCARACGVADVHPAARQLFESPEVDAVLICSATDTHAQLIEAAAAAGKHVFCEKPIALDLHRIDRALAAVEEAGIKLQVGFNRRFDPLFSQLREQIGTGNIGTPHLLRITSRDPTPPPVGYLRKSGGLFLDMTIHDFDMALYQLSAHATDVGVSSVFAVGACRIDPAIAEVGDIDTAVTTLCFADGTIATIDNSRKSVYGYDQRVEVFGSGGLLWADNRTESAAGRADRDGLHTPRPLDFFVERYAESYLIELQAFVDCIRDDTEPPVTGVDSRTSVLLALAAGRSMQQGRQVAPEEVDDAG